MERIEFDKEKISVVPIEQVRPNTWNPKVKDTPEYKKVVKSLKSNGLRIPIVVRDNEGFEILDGEQRYTAAKELGYKNVLIYNEGIVNDQKARELTIWYQIQVPFDEIETSYLVNDLLKKYPDLDLPYTESEINDFGEMAEFDFDKYNTELDEDEDGIRTFSVKLTKEQLLVVQQAMKKIQDADECSEGQAIERICADFLGR
ncbi:ParB/RepB/Spo0J family partition protein [Polynucleobacter sp.]|uniref:ParB/RepB/Spo0J family partition protein n=1 Tax=Polynucleobacter sp. TaxID=2029855 RepID=UPI003F6A4DD3